MIEMKCKQCGLNYYRVLSQILNSKFCSKACANLSKTLKLPALSQRQLEIINGCLLSDGEISKPRMKECGNARFSETHTIKCKSYVEWLSKELNAWSGRVFEYTTKNGYDCCRVVSKRHRFWTQLRNKWYPDGVKRVPVDVQLTPLTLACWYCGDGNNNIDKGVCNLATCGFYMHDVEMLVDKLKELKINSTITLFKKRHPRIYIRSNSYLEFINMIKPFVHECFNYKIDVSEWAKTRRVNKSFWKFRDQEGNIYETNNLHKFAGKHKLNPSSLSKVANKHRNSHKGWTYVDEEEN